MHSIKQYIHFRRHFLLFPLTHWTATDGRSECPMSTRMSTRRFPHIYPINSRGFKTGNKTHQCTLSNSIFTAAVSFLFFPWCHWTATNGPSECPMSTRMSTRRFPHIYPINSAGFNTGNKTHQCTLSNRIFTSGVSFFFFHWLTGQRPTVVLNVQCPCEWPRDDFRTFIQLIQQLLRLEARHANALYQTVYSLPPSLSYFSRDVTGQRPTVVLNVQCPRDVFSTFIQLIQQVLRLETRHTNALYQTVYSLPASLSSFSTDSLDSDRRSFWISNVHANVHATFSPHLSN